VSDDLFSTYAQSGRKIVVTGHYGSGKTEFAVSLAMSCANENSGKLALVDLDIVNPYFRSRERREMLEAAGVAVYGSAFRKEVTAEMPALGADIRAPLEDAGCKVIIDAGGNDSGSLVLVQYLKYLRGGDTTVLAVINANRPDTRDIRGAAAHLDAIEAAAGLRITGIVNNCHLVRETTAGEIMKGHMLCRQICETSGRRLLCNCYPVGIVDPAEIPLDPGELMPLGMYMRPGWL